MQPRADVWEGGGSFQEEGKTAQVAPLPVAILGAQNILHSVSKSYLLCWMAFPQALPLQQP